MKLLIKKSKSTNIDYIKNCDQEISSNSEIANVMNDYFCTIGTNLAKNIEETVNPLLSGKYQINRIHIHYMQGHKGSHCHIH